MHPQIPRDTASLLAKIPALAIPGISTRIQGLRAFYKQLQALLSHSPCSQFLSVLKYVACIILLVNANSLPFVWHIRVSWPFLVAKLEYMLRASLIFTPKAERARTLVAWVEGLSPVGANPFELVTVYRTWAGLDDSDMFGMHLSNSSYAKALDSVRLRALVKSFPTWGRSGGVFALGATHYHFIREIPALATYEVRYSIGSWDNKWMYFVARFVTHPKRRNANHSPPSQDTSTPATPNCVAHQNGTVDVEQAVTAVVAGPRAPILEPDGTILHCVSVSQMCFKYGRITMPPVVVLGVEGFTKPPCPNSGISSYSHTNPPPNWVKSQAVRVAPTGNMEKFQAFLKSGWRDVPERERWWEEAMGGPIEEKRQVNLEILESLRFGLERARTIY
ncbi:hypothetical protein PAXRUDRAFT_836001 [Paxillus rubicundulus Ve08.2h10]|uniref:Uncharacterized protein n=1 Tax=Paxillus rubicundulus Ve08.2h10 TaxID=930991 RepID=A0A0D0BSJ1_9AGAM|nr:hypothetical protein PAXRUDRAFT_836001 [Paxillus rubicundulus Ve08.2h10]